MCKGLVRLMGISRVLKIKIQKQPFWNVLMEERALEQHFPDEP